VDERPRIGFIAGLDHEQRLRYCEWWRKYIRLGWAAGLSFLVLLGSILLSNATMNPLARGAGKPALAAFVLLLLWRSSLDCPRCGERFRSWFGGEHDYFADECQNCGLSKREISAVARPR